MESQGKKREVLTGGSEKVYQKGWWKTGDKRQFKGGRIYYWREHGLPALDLEEIDRRPPFALRGDWGEEMQVYQKHVQSGAHWDRPGQVVWTDGARNLVTKEKSTYLSVGAGAYSPTHENLNFSARIGGEAVPARGEMGAMTLTVQRLSLIHI